MKVLIIGGVAGGASCAAKLRRLDENAKIIVFERGEYISFANCGLPYYIGEVIAHKENLIVQTPEAMKERFAIDIRVFQEVIAIDTQKKEVTVKNLKTNETYQESYDKLVLSPGANPIYPDIEGIAGENVFTLRNIPDTYAIKDLVDNKKPKHAVVVGAGYIGIEIAENLHARNVFVTIVELADHVLGPLDYEMATLVHSHLKNKRIEFYLNDGISGIQHQQGYSEVVLSSGTILKTDMIVLGIGVRPETTLAKQANLALGSLGGIQVDAHLRTSNEHIYAVGDAVEVLDYINGKPALIPLAGPANKQGRIVANNLVGNHEVYHGTQGTSVLKVFDMTVAATGNNEKRLKEHGISYQKSFTHSSSHAGYYPGSSPISLKLLFSPQDGKILGAQAVGYEGVEKRIDVIATAIRAKMTVHDLEMLELSYAPPFSSAKDPVNMAGYVASNMLKGETQVIHWHEVDKTDPNNTILVDVRTPEEFEMGTIHGALNIPIDDLRKRLSELPKDKNMIIFCQVGLRGYLALRILMQNGFTKVQNLSGGYKTYFPAVQKQSNVDLYDYEKITNKDEIEGSPQVVHTQNIVSNIQIDACGLQCPGPIMQVHKAIKSMNAGEVLEVSATDKAFVADIQAWCERTGNLVLNIKKDANVHLAFIRKGHPSVVESTQNKDVESHDKTMVVFSGDLDKAIAAFIIANGAAAMGRKVTMFFTFWGLNIIRKPEKVEMQKDFLSTMFGWMMPRGSTKLTLSKMNMGGIGGKLIRYIMQNKRVSSLEELILQAKAQDINMVACTMSMDVMGIHADEIIEGVTMGGVASYLSAAETADTNLFI